MSCLAPVANAGESHAPLAAQLTPPRFSHALVERPRLLRRLREAKPALVLVDAPAGYGKTTLLAQWAAVEPRPVAWLALRDADSDGVTFASHVAHALDAVEAVDADVFEGLAHGDAGLVPLVLPRLGRTLLGRTPFVLMLDDAQHLATTSARQVLQVLADHMPADSHLVVAGRTTGGLPLSRLRAAGAVTELGGDDLRLTPDEGAALLADSGVTVTSSEARAVVTRAEGWAAALYLTSLALRSGGRTAGPANLDGADQRAVARYFHDEVLSAVSADDRAFLTRTAILERLSAPLCDAVLAAEDSAARLTRLADANLFVTPVDGRSHWFQVHSLFAESLRAELDRAEPGLAEALHRRAAAWFADQGDPPSAIRHALAAGDRAAAVDLLMLESLELEPRGRHRELSRQLRWFSPDEIQAQPALAFIAAFCALDAGDGTGARDLLAAAEAGDPARTLADGITVAGAVAVLRGAVAPHGIAQMARDAAAGAAAAPPASPWLAGALFMQGAAAHLQGDLEQATEALRASERIASIAHPGMHVLGLAQQALIAVERGDLREAESLMVRARAAQRRHEFATYTWHASVAAVAGLVHALGGEFEAARNDVREGRTMLALHHHFAPWLGLQTRVILARAELLLGEVATARALLGEAEELQPAIADARCLDAAVDDLRVQLDTAAAGRATDSPLTTSELRVLQHLPTHLSLSEIGAELYISRNTVKTHLRAIYRKLDVTSRSAAVAEASRTGLL